MHGPAGTVGRCRAVQETGPEKRAGRIPRITPEQRRVGPPLGKMHA
jgi:hypothetical protein